MMLYPNTVFTRLLWYQNLVWRKCIETCS